MTHLAARARRAAVAALLLLLCQGRVAFAQSSTVTTPPATEAVRIEADLPPAFSKQAPEGLDDLRAIEEHVASLIEKLKRCTVGVRIGRAQGSGVIVSDDGYVLSAAHVSGTPGQRVEFILHDGRKVSGKSLGRNQTLDAGLMKIDRDSESWPHTEMAAGTPRSGDWSLVTGHPGGYQEGRAPVFRLGRVVFANKRVLQTDCELVGGDSGGPLFDMHGKVIGINSRIGQNTNLNFHVPIGAFTDDWERLVAAETFNSHSGALVGITGKPHELGLEITKVYPGEPAHEAGVKSGDILVTFDRRKVKSMERLIEIVGQLQPGRRVRIGVLRGTETLEITVRLGQRED